jgi:hypothetical protein
MGDISQAWIFGGSTGTINFSNDDVVQTYTAGGQVTPGIRLDSAADASDIINVTGSSTTFWNLTTTSDFSGTVPITNTSDVLLYFRTITLGGGTLSGAVGEPGGGAQAQWRFSTSTFTQTGGTFVAPTLIFVAGSTFNFLATQSVKNLTVNCGNGSTSTLSAGDQVIVTGTLLLTEGGSTGGTLEPQGDVTIASTFDGGTTSLIFSGSATQSFNLTGGTGLFNSDITINKTGGAVNLASALVMDASNQDLVIQEGTLDLSGNNLTVNGSLGTLVVQDGGTLRLQGGETITANASNPQLQSGSTVYYDGTSGPYTLKNYTTYQGLTIDGSGATFNLPAALDVNGNLTITAGTLDTTASNYQTNVAGNWSNTGTFNARAGTVIFDGTNQTISRTTTFNAFTKSVASAATLTFPASLTQTFTGTLTLNGASGQLLSLRSSITDTMAKIDPQSTRTLSYLDVKDNDNDNATAISYGTGFVNSGNNENWAFPGVTVSAISGNTTEAGGTATFTAVLNSQPTNDVSFTVASSDTTEGTIVESSLTFTNGNWSTPQTVTVTGVNDFLIDGSIGYTITTGATTSSDGNYNALTVSDVSVTNTDNDTAGVTVSAISGNTTEAGGTATFTAVLNSQPTNDVSFTIVSSDITEGTIPVGSLTFTNGNWSTPQTVTVTGVDDYLDDGDIAYSIITGATTSIDPDYNGVVIGDVAVTNTDNDVSGVTVNTTDATSTETGDTAAFIMVLTAQPTGDVEIDSVTTDATEGTVTTGAILTFTSVNWATPQTVTVTGQNDAVDDGDIGYSITTTVNAGNTADPLYDVINPSDPALTNTDNDAAGFTVSAISGDTSETSTTATFTVVLNSQPTNTVTVDVASADTTEGADDSTGTLTFLVGNWNIPQTVTVTGVNDDVADGDITYNIVLDNVQSTDNNYNVIDPADVAVTNTDNDTAGITVGTISGNTSETGSTATFTVVLDAEPTADMTIPISSSDTTEGTVSAATLTFTALNWSAPQTVTVTGANDDTVDGNIIYSIILGITTSTDPNYNNLNPANVAVTNLDNNNSGLTITEPTGGITLTEGGDSATYTVVLDSQPTGDVMVIITDGTEVSIDPTTLIFTPDNWSTPQTVTIAAVTDTNVDPDMAVTLAYEVSSTDIVYNNLIVVGNTVTVIDTPVEDTTPPEDPDAHIIVDTMTKTKSGKLYITYADGTSVIINPFSGSTAFRYKLSPDGTRILVTDGKYMQLYVGGVKTDQIRISNHRQVRSTYRLRQESLYKQEAYDNGIFWWSHNEHATLIIVRITQGNKLTRQAKRVIITNYKPPLYIRVRQGEHNVGVKIGKFINRKHTFHWHLKRDGGVEVVSNSSN